jgi:dimethylargininase
MFVAITRQVSPALADCELTHLERVPIDADRARAQHRAYEQALIAAGAMVQQLPAGADMPDSVFVEDIAVVFPELAIIMRPGAASRRTETAAIAHALAAFRPLSTIDAPGTIDGGDVLVAGRRVFVGLSTRTNDAAVGQMRRLLAPQGYTVCATEVGGCLHLKSAVTALDDRTLLVNPAWIDPAMFNGFDCVDVDESEPAAANALRLPDRVIFPAAFPRTAGRIEARGYRVARVDADELAKAEGAVTCCSLIVDGTSRAGAETGRTAQ